MSTFRVKTEWFGRAVGQHYLLAQATSYKRFLTTEYLYDLDISNTKVELAGPGTSLIDDTNDEIITEAPTFTAGGVKVYVVWFSLSEVASRFDGKAEGWRTREITCAKPKVSQSSTSSASNGPQDDASQPSDEPIGILSPIEYKGIELRFKGHIDTGTISTTFAAPTAKLSLKGQEITVPIGPSTTATSGGASKDCTGKYRLCPDGNGDYTVAEIEQLPGDNTMVLVENIRLKKWTHVK
ncbi:MAG: hypothetical protein ACJA2B_000723 [Candidatus Endobugula sp.]|jgi:hypothetical protein